MVDKSCPAPINSGDKGGIPAGSAAWRPFRLWIDRGIAWGRPLNN
jgi:hypothetical protein